MQTHTILGGKVQLFKRGQVWFARANAVKANRPNGLFLPQVTGSRFYRFWPFADIR